MLCSMESSSSASRSEAVSEFEGSRLFRAGVTMTAPRRCSSSSSSCFSRVPSMCWIAWGEDGRVNASRLFAPGLTGSLLLGFSCPEMGCLLLGASLLGGHVWALQRPRGQRPFPTQLGGTHQGQKRAKQCAKSGQTRLQILNRKGKALVLGCHPYGCQLQRELPRRPPSPPRGSRVFL